MRLVKISTKEANNKTQKSQLTVKFKYLPSLGELCDFHTQEFTSVFLIFRETTPTHALRRLKRHMRRHIFNHASLRVSIFCFTLDRLTSGDQKFSYLRGGFIDPQNFLIENNSK